MSHLIPLLAFSLPLALTWGAMPSLLYWLHRRRLYDVPGERSSHARPTPTGGGLLPVVGLGLAVALAAAGGRGPAGAPGFLAGVLVLLIVGLVDDRAGLPAPIRLACQLTAAGLFFLSLATDYGLTAGTKTAAGGLSAVIGKPLPPGIALPGSTAPGSGNGIPPWFLVAWFLGVVWSVNLYNFMDGIDGLAGSEAVIGGLFLAWIGHHEQLPGITVLGLAAAGGAIGFLRWNFPWRRPARIFMGDAGSTAFGFTFAAAWTLLWLHGSSWRWLAPLPLANFILDATLTLGLRAYRREAWYRPHREHLYQLLVRAGWSHRRVTIIEALTAITGVLCARWAMTADTLLPAAGYLVALTLLWLAGRSWATGKLTTVAGR
jgi:UDP-N-acetylmuramyl pentapeptide phosphotransferase/UDP-N-acetylglucosamine-1-phosphate transferase